MDLDATSNRSNWRMRWCFCMQLSSEEIERRRRLESAVEGDDWSGVIDGQTKLTEDPAIANVEAPSATIIRCILFFRLYSYRNNVDRQT